MHVLLQGKHDRQSNGPEQQMEQPLQKAQSAVTATAPSSEAAPSVTKPQSSPIEDASHLAAQHSMHVTQHSAAAADSASAQELVCRMQAQVAALEWDKSQLSTQLSAAHSRVQGMKAAANRAEEGKLERNNNDTQNKQQCQMASKLAQV